MNPLHIRKFIIGLNSVANEHQNWVAVALGERDLRAMPRHDLKRLDCIFNLDAHKICKFGRWFRTHRQTFDYLDEDRTRELKIDHYHMHEAARIYYSNVEKNRAWFSQLVSRQSDVVDHLTYFKSKSVSLLKLTLPFHFH
jgi:hypothetical protein